MSQQSQILPPPGEVIDSSGLRTRRGAEFAGYLRGAEKSGFVFLRGTRRQWEPPGDVIVFEIEPERPQQLENDIREAETIAVVFSDDDVGYPEVLALRNDFPLVPHVNLRVEEFPRSLCLYDQAWTEEKPSWTPATFLQRIQTWLSKTADGSLHGSDQPLEPLIAESNWHLVVPPDFVELVEKGMVRNLVIVHHAEHAHLHTLVAQWHDGRTNSQRKWICATFKCAPQAHGVIRRTPATLEELHEICRSGGVELLDQVRDTIGSWLKDPPMENFLAAMLIIVVILPKTRTKDGVVESTETRAFVTGKTVREIGDLLGITGGQASVAGGATGMVLFPEKPDPSKFTGIEVGLIGVHRSLDASMAAAMNGMERLGRKMIAVGAGAYGSQVLNNMVRAGAEDWTIVDHDILKPHNFARHLLPAQYVGCNKAVAVAEVLATAINVDAAPIRAIPIDVLNPGKHEKELEQAEAEAELLFDFSASVAVARKLARAGTGARGISSFVTPSGNGMVILAEDNERALRLDWLEALHYRTIIGNQALRKSLQRNDRSMRTGASCRDISLQIGQAEMATWAGIFSQQITSILSSVSATVKIFQREADGSVAVFSAEPTLTFAVTRGDWTFLLDRWLIEKLSGFRKDRLPNETGGVLLGVLDSERRSCLITEALPSPSDSEEWPTSYIRGCHGLLESVADIEAATVGQLTYIGEWHSHPAGCSTRPSGLDLQAFAALKQERDAECLPTVILIVGESQEFSVMGESSKES